MFPPSFPKKEVPVFARLVRYEVGQPQNAEGFIDEVMRRFDSIQESCPSGMVGSFLFTRRDEGEALEVTLWEKEEFVNDAATLLDAAPAPETGAREVVTGRRADTSATAVETSSQALWEVWQGRQEWRAQ